MTIKLFAPRRREMPKYRGGDQAHPVTPAAIMVEQFRQFAVAVNKTFPKRER